MPIFFFFNDTATTEIYTLSLHDALPISSPARAPRAGRATWGTRTSGSRGAPDRDRKSTRLNSSHGYISYAFFCLKKKKIMSTRQSTYFETDDRARQVSAMPSYEVQVYQS